MQWPVTDRLSVTCGECWGTFEDATLVTPPQDLIYSPALKKGRGGYIGFGLSVILSVPSFVRPSICLFICSSVIIFSFRIEFIQLLYVY